MRCVLHYLCASRRCGSGCGVRLSSLVESNVRSSTDLRTLYRAQGKPGHRAVSPIPPLKNQAAKKCLHYLTCVHEISPLLIKSSVPHCSARPFLFPHPTPLCCPFSCSHSSVFFLCLSRESRSFVSTNPSRARHAQSRSIAATGGNAPSIKSHKTTDTTPFSL